MPNYKTMATGLTEWYTHHRTPSSSCGGMHWFTINRFWRGLHRWIIDSFCKSLWWSVLWPRGHKKAKATCTHWTGKNKQKTKTQEFAFFFLQLSTFKLIRLETENSVTLFARTETAPTIATQESVGVTAHSCTRIEEIVLMIVVGTSGSPVKWAVAVGTPLSTERGSSWNGGCELLILCPQHCQWGGRKWQLYFQQTSQDNLPLSWEIAISRLKT